LEIERSESSLQGIDRVLIRLAGRWRDPERPHEGKELLVVEVEGRRHRFPALAEPEHAAVLVAGGWTASFALPAWAEPLEDGQASLWLGNAVVPVPAASRGAGEPDPPREPVRAGEPDPPREPVRAGEPDPPREPVRAGEPEPPGEPVLPGEPEPPREPVRAGEPEPPRDPVLPGEPEPPAGEPSPASAAAPPEPERAPRPPDPERSPRPPGPERNPDQADDPRSGPLSELLLKETVAALRAELSERAAGAAQLRGALADAEAELQARATMQARLEATHLELRRELDQLVGLIQQEDSRKTALESSAAAMAIRVSELEAQLTEAQERHGDAQAQLDAARGQLAEAQGQRAEAEQRLAESVQRQAQVQQRLAEENAGLRDELAALRVGSERDTDLRVRAEIRERELSAEIRELHAELATATVSRDAAVSEASGLRAELDRLGGELAAAREQRASREGDLGEAQTLLSDARALSAQLRERQAPAASEPDQPA
jgi:hypothetical protein